MNGKFIAWQLAQMLAVSGCSALLDLEARQCTDDADCFAERPTTPLMCRAGLCVAPSCRVHSDCTAELAAEARVCIEGACRPLLSPEVPQCFARFPREGPVRDDAVLLGGFSDSLQRDPVNRPLMNYELAIDELNAAGGLPPTNRQVVLVVCDNGALEFDARGQRHTLTAGLAHLVHTLKVAGVAAGLTSPAAVREAFQEVKEARPLFVVPFASDGVVLGDDHGSIWYLLDGGRDGDALIALLHALAAPRTRGGAPRITLWRGGEDAATALVRGLLDELRRAYPANLTEVDATARDALEQVIASAPEIMIAADSVAFVERLEALERRWGSRPKPLYIMTRELSNSEALRAYLERTPEVDVARFFGVRPYVAETAELAAYRLRFAQRFPEFVGGAGAYNYYDSVYYLAYAAFLGTPRGSAEVRSKELRMGFGRLTGGPRISVGPLGTMSLLQTALQGGGSIQLLGTLGPAGFDELTGSPKGGSASVYCFAREQGVVRRRYDVLVYNEQTRALDPDPTKPPCDGLPAAP